MSNIVKVRPGNDDNNKDFDVDQLENSANLIKDPYYDNINWFWTPHGFIQRILSPECPCVSRIIRLNSKHVNPSDIDTVIGSLILVNALFLTLPFAMMTALTYDTMDSIQEKFEGCPDKYFPPSDLAVIVNVSIQVPFFAIVICLWYYFCRPGSALDFESDEAKKLATNKFVAWWKRGRILLFASFTLTVLGCCYMLTSTNQFYQLLLTPSNRFCDGYQKRVFNLSSIYTSGTVLVFFLFYLVV